MSAYKDYLNQNSQTTTPQSQPIPGREQDMVPNNAGGYGFKLDDWQRLERFLIIGSEGGTAYVGQRTLTEQNAQCAIRCIKEDGPRAVEMAVDINLANRAPKTDQQLFVLALAMKHGDQATKNRVLGLDGHSAAPEVLRTGTHVLHFAAMLDGLGGWNRSKRRLIKRWFEEKTADALAFHALKYQSRDGWSMRDLLRVAHPSAPSLQHAATYDWICGRVFDTKPVSYRPGILTAHEQIKALDETPQQKALRGIECGLPREALPTEALADKAVWRALLPQTPMHALIRNLGVITANGTIDDRNDEVASGENRLLVANKLRDAEQIMRQRVHPFALLLAQVVYSQGHGVRGKNTWVPLRGIIEALDDAYEIAFDNVVPTNQRLLVAIDVSGSMTAPCMGTPIPANLAAAAMALTIARSEPHATVVQFDTEVQKIVPITKRSALSTLAGAHGGGTDVASPVIWATGDMPAEAHYWRMRPAQGPAVPPKRADYDAFIILTDNETWAGARHPVQALEKYRREVNPNAKLICCAMAANHANVVDDKDPLSLTCVGLDATLPTIVSEFLRW